MRAARYEGQKAVVLGSVPDPQPGPGEVIVRVRACGICGSDLHRYRAGGLGSSAVPGHEIAGEIAALGPDVDGWEMGTPVAVEPLVVCRACPACLRGDYQICPRRLLLGAGRDGGLAERVRVPAYGLYRLPAGLTWPVAALAEPAAVAVHGLRLAEVGPGARVLVQGSGTIGLLSVLAASERGAAVTATARYPHQAEAAFRFGAEQVYAADESGSKELAAASRAQPYDIVIETVGGEADTLVQAPALARPGGKVCVLGVFFHPPRVDALALVLREVRMVGAITYGRDAHGADFAEAIQLLDRHRDQAASLITHTCSLDRVAEAYALADDKSSLALKVTVQP